MATSRQQFLLGSQLILRLLGVLFSIAVLALSAVYVVLGNAEDQVASNVAVSSSIPLSTIESCPLIALYLVSKLLFWLHVPRVYQYHI